MKRPVRIDKDELSALGKVEFTWPDIADFVALISDYAERFQDQLPDFMLKDAEPSELGARRAFVDAVEAVWRERHRKKGLGAHYNPIDDVHTGPLVAVLQYLLCAAREANPPKSSTLYYDLKFLVTERERNRGKPHTRAKRG